MTDYIIGCDNIDGKEKSYQKKVAEVLEAKGHSTEILSVGPNFTQTKGLSSSCKGKTAIFIVGGSDIGTYVDFRDGIKNGYYHYKYAWFAFASWTATTWITCKELKSRALVRAHDDNFSSSGSISKYIGKSADDFFKDNKDVLNYVCGQTPEELAKKILGGGGGSDSEDKASGGTVKDALKKVVSKWDGDIEVRIREDTVYVNKIPDPTTATLTVDEYSNVIYDSVTVTDGNPQTVNMLTGNWNGNTLTLKDELAIERFGEQQQEATEELFAEVKTLEEAKKVFYREWHKIRRDSGRSIELKINGDSNFQSGKWCRAYLPSYRIDDYMYISKTSNETDGTSTWQTGLTLVDYPPSFGAYVEETTEEEEEEETEEVEEEEEV